MTFAEGPPGWIWPSIATSVVLSTWTAAAFGAPAADAFLTNHGGHVVAWMATTMAPWLAYKAVKYHSDNTVAKAQVEAEAPAVEGCEEGEVGK